MVQSECHKVGFSDSSIKNDSGQKEAKDTKVKTGIAVKPREITLRQCQGVSLVIPVSLNGVKVSAVVDTAAHVTVVNEEVAQT